jgi:hypothetical protein
MEVEPPDRRCRDVLDLAQIALPGGNCPRQKRGRLFNIDLMNKLERTAVPRGRIAN